MARPRCGRLRAPPRHGAADFERRHPAASRIVGALAWVVLAVALVVEIPEIASLVARAAGSELDSPFGLPPLVTGVLGVLALAAALDRALRLKQSRWLG